MEAAAVCYGLISIIFAVFAGLTIELTLEGFMYTNPDLQHKVFYMISLVLRTISGIIIAVGFVFLALVACFECLAKLDCKNNRADDHDSASQMPPPASKNKDVPSSVRKHHDHDQKTLNLV